MKQISSSFLIAMFVLVLFHSGCKHKPEDLVLVLKDTTLSNISNNQVDTTSISVNDTIDNYNLLWPAWVFSHWIWEDESTQQSAQQLVDDYLAHDIPVGAIIIDSPWETGYNTFTYDPSIFPQPQAMINYFHSKNIKVMMWITGIINTDVQPMYDYARSHNYFMQSYPLSNSPAEVDWWKGTGSLIDYYNPEACTWWKSQMDPILNLGIDGWKCDGTDFSILPSSSYSPAKGSFVSRPDYSEHYYRLFHDYTREKLGNKRVNTTRPVDNYGYSIGGENAAFGPTDITFAGWVGDQDATFDGLKAALNNMYESDAFGYLSFGSDIGGYREDNNYAPMGRSKELFIRWAQLGAFSPVMENGGGGEHRPWMFDDETTKIYRRFAKLHTKMIPYFMAQSKIAFEQHESLMNFFNKTDYAYLLGTDIFVSPILSNTTSVIVNFPAGSTWVYYFDKDQKYIGGQTYTVEVPLTEYPVFFKEDSPYLAKIKDPGL